jgi:hypothetical protein
MKKILFSIATAALVSIFLFVGCKKDEDTNNPPTNENYRLKQVENYEGDDIQFIYNQEFLEEIRGESGSTVISNPNPNLAIATNENSKTEYKSTDGKLEELIFYQKTGKDDYEEVYKYTFNYNSDGLESLNYYSNESGVLELKEKELNSYEGGKIVETIEMEFVGGWKNKRKYEYEYSGDFVERKLLYNYSEDNWVLTDRYIFENNGQSIISEKRYHNFSGNWELNSEKEYNYDSNGNISSISGSNQQGTAIYTYEVGEGNLEFFIEFFGSGFNNHPMSLSPWY